MSRLRSNERYIGNVNGAFDLVQGFPKFFDKLLEFEIRNVL